MPEPATAETRFRPPVDPSLGNEVVEAAAGTPSFGTELEQSVSAIADPVAHEQRFDEAREWIDSMTRAEINDTFGVPVEIKSEMISEVLVRSEPSDQM